MAEKTEECHSSDEGQFPHLCSEGIRSLLRMRESMRRGSESAFCNQTI